MLLSFVALYFAVTQSAYLGWFLFVIVIAFIRVVHFHSKISRELDIMNRMVRRNQAELEFLNGNKTVFDTGSDIECRDHVYANDLDLFGTGSLFQTINRTATIEGRQKLTADLLNLNKTNEELSLRKEAIEELTSKFDFRDKFIALGNIAGESKSDMDELRQWASQSEFYQGRIWLLRFAVIMLIANIVSAGVMIWLGTGSWLPWLMIIVINNIIIGQFSKSIKKYFEDFGDRTKLFEKFSELFAHSRQESFKSRLNVDLHSKIEEASQSFYKLSRLANLAEQRDNAFVGPFMNSVFLFDAWTIRNIERWRLQYKNQIEEWIDSLATFDQLNSYANFTFNHPTFRHATIIEKQQIVSSEMGHPLIPDETSVKNDYAIGVKDKAHVITGSNMAGKSTFIRAVGLNVVLALNGLPVCAKTFSCPRIHIASCIRINDSLEDHASYFRAELNRLEFVMNLLKTGESYLVLLDEILRGTNSEDKRQGTLAFFSKFRNYNCLALLATHDLAIGDLAKTYPNDFANYAFESKVSGREISFDYKIHPGVSTSTNATFLMKSMGLID